MVSKNTKLLFVFIMLAVFFMSGFFVAPFGLPATLSTFVQPHTALAAAAEEAAAPCDPTSSRPGGTPQRTFIVNTTCDLPDSNLGDNQCLNSAGSCSFRAALEQAAAWSGPNRIEFNIRNSDSSCPNKAVIVGNPAYYENMSGDNTQLGGFVVEDDETVIDGYTQCSADPNGRAINGNADIRIQIEGNGTIGTPRTYHGLVLKSDYNEVRGLSVVNWGRGIELREASYNTIAGNFVGLNTDEQVAGNFIGLYINYESTYNIVGGINRADRNIVSGNVSDGIKLNGLGVTENQVIGNYVGLKQNGSTVAGNGLDGIDMESQAHHNWVGGILLANDELFPVVQPSRSVTNALLDSEGNAQVDIRKRNIVAGNRHNGIEISQKLATKENRIVGNWVGMDAYGNQVGNGLIGITIEDRANHNLVYLNIVVGSNAHGVRFYTVYENELYQNWIGIRPAGTERLDGVILNEEPMPNGVTGYNQEGTQYYGRSGIEIMGGSNGNMIYENVIAHNKEHGIHLKALAGYLSDPLFGGYGSCFSSYNTISRNSMFANAHPEGIRLGSALCDELSIGIVVYGVQNFDIEPPQILATSSNEIAWIKASPSDTVEIFVVESNPPYTAGEGKRFVGSAVADSSGLAMVPLTDVSGGTKLTATATDVLGNTSQFSENRTVADYDCNNAPSSPAVTAERNDDEVVLDWPSVYDATGYHVYRTADPQTPITAAHLYAVVTSSAFTDYEAFENGSEAYYTVRATACGQESADSNWLAAYQLVVEPGWNLLSWPIVPLQTQLDAAVGDQLRGTNNPQTADRIMTWNPINKTYQAYWYCGGACVDWGAPWANHWLDGYDPSTAVIHTDQGFWVQNRASFAQTIIVIGNVATATRSQTIQTGWNLLGYSSADDKTLAQLNLPATGTNDPTTSNQIVYWDAAAQKYQTAWFCACPTWGDAYNNKWLTLDFTASPIMIRPGTGFWYLNRTNGTFSWQLP